MPRKIQKRELTIKDYKETFENFFLMPKGVSKEAEEKHYIELFYGVDKTCKNIWVAVNKPDIQAELLNRRGHNINPIMVNRGEKVFPEYHLKRAYREEIEEYYIQTRWNNGII